MRYIQFYQMSVAWKDNPSKPIDACGDRSVIIVDARKSINFAESLATLECKKRKYIGYSIHEGESFTRSRMVKKYKEIS